MNNYPQIYLAIDNCVLSKRITEPEDWMKYFKDLGIYHIEASADNELDPFYTGPEYIKDWRNKAKKASRETGVKIVNLYSGHGTYSTLGLGHTDIRVKDRMLGWVKEMVNTAAEIGSGLGFFCHAFPQKVLQDPQLFSSAWNDLIYRFSLIADYAEKNGVKVTGVEQMYSPHQVPWTIEQAKAVLSETQKHTDAPFYITLDTGHQSGQHKYLMPSEEQINQELKYCRKESEKYPRIWLGPDKAYSLFKQALDNSPEHDKLYIEQIMEAMKNTPYLFALHSDGDTYKWLEQLAGYSPIIHLQQTDGKSSAHWAFTEKKTEPV